MRQTLLKTAWVFSWIVAVLMLLQSCTGLLFRGLYRDNLFVKSAWYGNDWVTLTLAVPLLVLALIEAMRGSRRAMLLWLGMLAYSVYNYAFYVFGSVLNAFFLVFVALFTASLYALIFGLTSLDAEAIAQAFSPRTPARRISVYMFLWAIVLSGLWVFQSLDFAYTGELPEIVLVTNYPTNVTAILDLSLMVPAVFLSAWLLWHRQAWGYSLAVIMNVKGALYALVLAVGSYAGARNGIPGLVGQIPLWLILSGASACCCLLLLGHMQPLASKWRIRLSPGSAQGR
jgi:hypothetical protein